MKCESPGLRKRASSVAREQRTEDASQVAVILVVGAILSSRGDAESTSM